MQRGGRREGGGGYDDFMDTPIIRTATKSPAKINKIQMFY